MSETNNDELLKTIKRLETRVLRGFSGLGVDVMADTDWLKVTGNTITITNTSHSLTAIMKRAKERGALIGERPIDVVFEGRVLCVLTADNHVQN